jgi:hypothetical protein
MTTSKLVLSAALILVTLSGAGANSWDPVPGDRNPDPVTGPGLLGNRSVYDARMQTGRSAPTIYFDTRDTYLDRASQTVDGGN